MLGEGIETDMIEALTWLIISAREGNKDASAMSVPSPCSQPTQRVGARTSTVLAKGPQKAQFWL